MFPKLEIRTESEGHPFTTFYFLWAVNEQLGTEKLLFQSKYLDSIQIYAEIIKSYIEFAYEGNLSNPAHQITIDIKESPWS